MLRFSSKNDSFEQKIDTIPDEKYIDCAKELYKQLWPIILNITKNTTNKKQIIGKIGNISICLVDGDKVKQLYDMNFVEGGHDLIYNFIPSKEIWIDFNLDKHDYKYIILHEFVERELMITMGIAYKIAHNCANIVEKEARYSRKLSSHWIHKNCKFCSYMQQQLFEFDDPSDFSHDPNDHPDIKKVVEQYTPEGQDEEEWIDGFYHVTTNLPAVLHWGALRSRKQLGNVPGLGPGVEGHGTRQISITHNSQKAYSIYNGLIFATQVAHGMVLPSAIFDEITTKMGIDNIEGVVKNFLSGYVNKKFLKEENLDKLGDALNNNKFLKNHENLYDFMVGLEDACTNFQSDWELGGPSERTGFTIPYDIFSKINPKNIAIIQLQVRKNAPFDSEPLEQELRYAPDDIKILKVIESAK